jgi:hypothetical protein
LIAENKSAQAHALSLRQSMLIRLLTIVDIIEIPPHEA